MYTFHVCCMIHVLLLAYVISMYSQHIGSAYCVISVPHSLHCISCQLSTFEVLRITPESRLGCYFYIVIHFLAEICAERMNSYF
jgi:hypothetical protein